MKKNKWIYYLSVPGVILASALPSTVYAAVYLSEDEAKQVIFPDMSLESVSITLTDEQRKEIKAKTKVPVRVKELKVWKADDGSYLFIDEVLGKHEFITYAIGIQPDGTVRQVEIMEYRESYGYEVRQDDWRGQFVGKSSASPLKLDQDIKNISGATLSCRHIADGVKRILATYETVLR